VIKLVVLKEAFMTAFLKIIGSSKSPCQEPYTKPYADFLPAPEEVTLAAQESSDTQLMLLGREPRDCPRHIWWNFFSSSSERIKQARTRYKGLLHTDHAVREEFFFGREVPPLLRGHT
jgi:Pirin C-terminal cupin domain